MIPRIRIVQREMRERHIILTPFRKGVADRLPPPLWGRFFFTSLNQPCQPVSKLIAKINSLHMEVLSAV